MDAEVQSSAEGAMMEASSKSGQHVAVATKDTVIATDMGDEIDTERHKRVDCDLADTTPRTSEEEGSIDITAPANREGNADINTTDVDSKMANFNFEVVDSKEGIGDASPAVINVGDDTGTSLSDLIFVDILIKPNAPSGSLDCLFVENDPWISFSSSAGTDSDDANIQRQCLATIYSHRAHSPRE